MVVVARSSSPHVARGLVVRSAVIIAGRVALTTITGASGVRNGAILGGMFKVASVTLVPQVALQISATAAGETGVGKEMGGSDKHELSGRFLLMLVQD